MKPYLRIALLLAALCMAGAIGAYVTVGSTQSVNFQPVQLEDASGLAEREEEFSSATPRAERLGPAERRAAAAAATPWISPTRSEISRIPAPNSIPESAVERPDHFAPRVAVRSRVPATPGVTAAPALPTSAPLRVGSMARSSEKEVSSPFAATAQTVQDEAGGTAPKATDKPSAETPKPGGPEVDGGSLPPEVATPASPRPARRPWPRGNFTPEQEMIRAQMGWQAFADEVFQGAVEGTVP